MKLISSSRVIVMSLVVAGVSCGDSEKTATRGEPGSGFAVPEVFARRSRAVPRIEKAARADYARDISPGEGFWGDWRDAAMCPPGQFANAFQMRVEPSQGGGDDTALNAVFLACTQPNAAGPWSWISSHDGFWGSNGWPGICGPTQLLVGAMLKLEGKQGSGDDTAANAIAGYCSNAARTYGQWVYGDNAGGWGTWQWNARAMCEPGEAVCGLQSRVESPQGSRKDDTALNGLKFFCCKL